MGRGARTNGCDYGARAGPEVTRRSCIPRAEVRGESDLLGLRGSQIRGEAVMLARDRSPLSRRAKLSRVAGQPPLRVHPGHQLGIRSALALYKWCLPALASWGQLARGTAESGISP